MRIISDIDECVQEYIQGFCDFYNDLMGTGLLRHDDFETFSFQDTLGISAAKSDKIRGEYMMSKFFDNMKFVPGAKKAIRKLAGRHSIDFVTMRPDNHKLKTRDCFDRSFPRHSFDVYFEGADKLDRIRKLGGEVVIEDSVSSLEYAEAGIPVLLFNRKWNRGVEHENIYRCYSWGDILDKVGVLDNV